MGKTEGFFFFFLAEIATWPATDDSKLGDFGSDLITHRVLMIVELHGHITSPPPHWPAGDVGMAVPSEVLGLGVQGPSEAGFEGPGLGDAGSAGLGSTRGRLEGRDSRRQDLGCRDPTGQDLRDSGMQRGRFGDRHPMKHMGSCRHLPKGQRFGLSGAVSAAAAPGLWESGVCRGGAWMQERHRTGLGSGDSPAPSSLRCPKILRGAGGVGGGCSTKVHIVHKP